MTKSTEQINKSLSISKGNSYTYCHLMSTGTYYHYSLGVHILLKCIWAISSFLYVTICCGKLPEYKKWGFNEAINRITDSVGVRLSCSNKNDRARHSTVAHCNSFLLIFNETIVYKMHLVNL